MDNVREREFRSPTVEINFHFLIFNPNLNQIAIKIVGGRNKICDVAGIVFKKPNSGGLTFVVQMHR